MQISIHVGNQSGWLDSIVSWANVGIGICALVVAVISILLARSTLKNQTHHNKLSVRPLPYFVVADYDNKTLVAIRNNGTGPLIIRRVWVSDGLSEKQDLIGWMPPHPSTLSWSHFSSVLAGRSISPTHEIVLIELRGDPGRQVFVKYRDLCRSVLTELTAYVEYTDIYGDNFEVVSRKLDWFGRTDPK